MKRFVAVAALTLLVSSAAFAAAPQEMMMEPEMVKGVVIDTACYAAGKHGPEEVGCTKMCLNMGVPASFLTESGEVLILLPPADEGDMTAFKSLKSYAAAEVTITGMVLERDGLKAMMVMKVEAAS